MPVRETLSSVETVFARTEHLETTVRAEVEAKIARVRHVLARRNARAAVLTQAGSVAWVTAGITNPIERGNPASPLWVVVTPDRVTALTINVELPRLRGPLARIGLSLEDVNWYEPDGLAAGAAEIVGPGSSGLVSDEPSLGDGADDLVAIRLSLLLPERERLTTLGQDAVAALESALRAWRPGERDFDVQARAGEQLERVGALGVCLFVGGDERVERVRHPLPVGAPIRRFVMAGFVAGARGAHAG